MKHEIIRWLLILTLSFICCDNHAIHKFSIPEQQPPTTLGKIRLPSSSNISANTTTFTAKQILFSHHQYRFFIDINTTTGVISSLTPIDREEIDLIRIWIMDLTRDDIVLSEIVIEIIDINDNPPRFNTPVLHASISELAQVGDVIQLLAPTDLDTGRNGLITLTLLEKSTRFSIYHKQESDHWYLILSPDNKLDREVEPYILLNVSCMDGGSSPLESQATINITILDANDNSPRFQEQQGQSPLLLVPASTKINTPIISLNATDLDIGKNSMIRFTWSGNGTRYFAVNNHGFLYLAESIVVRDSPICRPAYFRLSVNATDHGTPSRSSSTELTIQVYSQNNPPTLKLKDRIVSVSETIQWDGEITTGTVSDDCTDKDDIELKLLNHQSVFKIGWLGASKHQFYISAGNIDYKQRKSYKVILQASDGEMLANTTLHVTIKNVNNYPPVFDQKMYHMNFSMTSPIDSFVGIVSASDPDFNKKEENVTFSLIASRFSEYFKIESSSSRGILLLQKHLPTTIDSDSILLEVISSDNNYVYPQPSRTSKSTITIRLHDKEQTCRPVFVASYPTELTLDTTQSSELHKKVIARYEVSTACCIIRNCFFSLQQNVSDKLFTLDNEGRLVLQTLPSAADNIQTPILLRVSVHNIHDLDLKDTATTLVNLRVDRKVIRFNHGFNFVHLPQRNSKVGTLITTLAVPSHSARYGITEDTKSLLRIDNTGRIFLQQELPHASSKTCFMFKVTATAVALARNTSTLLMLSILDKTHLLNYTQSAFTRTDYSFVISEDSPVDWVIGRLTLHPSLSDATDTPYYFIDSAAKIASTLFNIDQDGYLRVGVTKQRVHHKRKYTFKVVVVLNCQLFSTNVYMRIQDLNTNRPLFTSPRFAYVATPTDGDISLPVYKATALDIDRGRNAQLSYKLIRNGDGYFCINERTGHVYLQRTMNASQRRVFPLKLLATDHGFPQRSSTMDLLLIANKTINNGKESVYYTEIDMASTSPMVPFFKIPKQVIQCQLQTHSDTFGVYQNGWIYALAIINNKNNTIFQQKRFYRLRVSTRYDDVIVYVTVRSSGLPMNIFSSTSFEFDIEENAKVGSIIGNISLVPHDDTPIVYIPEANEYVEIVNTNKLRLKSPIDCHQIRENRCHIVFHVIGVFNGTKEVSVLHVLVRDLNNHAPRFVSDSISYELDAGQLILPPFEVLDNDLFVEFNLTILEGQNCSSDFKIRSNRIVLLRPMQEESCVLNVRLYDQQQGNDSTNVVIFNTLYKRLYSLPDKFENQSLSFNISEGVVLGTVIYKPDYPVSKILVFKLAKSEHFLVHPFKGVVKLSKQLDYEAQEIHYLFISVISLTNETSTINITVYVTNVNDNTPVPNDSSVSLDLADSTTVGTNVFTCHVVDLDRDQLTFAIHHYYEEEYTSDFFALHPGGGCSVTLQKTLKLLTTSTSTFNISVFDGVHTSQINIQLKVTRDSEPEIVSPPGCLISDDVSPGNFLYKIEVEESYKDEISSYALEPGSPTMFYLNSSTGVLKLQTKWPTGDTLSLLSMYITTKQGRSTFFQVMLFKSRPSPSMAFSSDIYTRSIDENNSPGLLLVQVRVPSLSRDVVVHYIVAGNHGNHFKMDAQSGKIVIRDSLDFERMANHRFRLKVYAINLNDYQTAHTEVWVLVNNVNDNAPRFLNSGVLEAWVSENVANQLVLRVDAVDFDAGDNVTYGITSGDTNNKFSIHSNGSLVINSTPLDHEVTKEYHLRIKASDDRSPPLSTETSVIVHVTDSNDNPPVYSKTLFFFNVSDTTLRGSSLGICTATDLDTRVNGELHYEIVSGDFGYFSMDPVTGKIFLDEELDCGTICVFYMTITVEDNGKPMTLKTNSTVVINVLPTTEPILYNHRYAVQVPHNISVNSQVTALEIRPPGYLLTSQLFFSLLNNNNNNDLFSVNSDGVIYSCSMIPKNINNILLQVKVSRKDSGCMIDTEIATVIITFTHTNDPPAFLTTPVFYVSESTRIGSTVGRVNVVNHYQNHYQNMNGIMQYIMIDFPSLFFILKQNGMILLRQQLDYESQREHQFEIEVFPSLKPQLKTKQMVYIFVEDSNDNRPEFVATLNRTVAVLIQDSYPGMVAQMKAFDRDRGKNSELSYKLDGDCSDIFWMSSTDGSLWIVNNNNTTFNHGDIFEVGITVKDSGIPSLSQSATIVITFLERNTKPRFAKHHFQTDIEENKLPASKIYTFLYEDKDKAMINRQRNTFRIIASHNKFRRIFDHFSIGKASGVLQQLKSIDREEYSVFIFYVVLLDGAEEVDRAKVTVNILDINDSPPVIVPDQQGFLEENLLAKVSVFTVKASDDDIGLNGRLKYSILTKQSDFEIDMGTGAITATRSFDYETQRQYHLQIQVCDSAPPFHTVAGNITIFIHDLNDNPPRFNSSTVTDCVLPYSSPSGTYITTLKASDADTEINSRMQFSIINNTKVDIGKYTGVIVLARQSANVSSFTVQVCVFDPTNPGLNADHQTIQVQFIKDSFPVLKDTSLRLVHITENDESYIKEPFHQIHLDSIISNVQFELVSSNHDQFKINKTTGEIYLRRALDYEKNRWHDVWVCATTINKPKIQTCCKTVVFVNDTNDNLPCFKDERIVFQVEENRVDKLVGRLTAFDKDEDDAIYYHLGSSAFAQQFNINKTTGIISSPIDFDYEQARWYSFSGFATNYPDDDDLLLNTSSWNSIFVQVNILDQNESPVFINPPTSIAIPEDHPTHHPFFTFRTRDPDESSRITFTVVSPGSILQISSPGGELILLRNLDREGMGSNQSISVTASDGEFTIQHNVTLIITDINDSPPRFSSDNFIIEFPEDTTQGNQIFKFNTTDEDESVNAVSDIFFANQTERSIRDRFNLHKNGSLYISQSSYFQITGKPLEFNFTVEARNRMQPFYITSSNVTVRIIDVNDHSPLFGESFYEGFIQADAQVGQLVVTVNATDDSDLDLNAKIQYQIVGGNGSSNFQIDSEVGQITVKLSLAKYSNQNLILVVRAVDSGNLPLSDTCTVKLSIEQVNLHSPQVKNEPYSRDLNENHTVGDVVVQIDASDVESKTNLMYQVLNESSKQWRIFDNGSLVLWSPLDYETKTSFILDIKITDASVTNPKSTQTTVTINVLNINDEPPIFQQQEGYHLSIPENFNTSNPVIKVRASDPDSTAVIYFLAESANESFAIGSMTGDIYALVGFDYEKERFYKLLVEASDNGVPPLKSNVLVSVNITGVNEYWPRFESDSYTFDISRRHQNIGHSIGDVKAADMDFGRDGECIYKIASPAENGFHANSSTGDILLSRRSLRRITRFTVLALNRNRQDFFDSAHVQVTVVDFTGAPVFEKDHYQVFVKENVSENTSIAQFLVSHYDGDNIIYEMSDDDYGLPFSLDRKTGELYLSSPLDYEQAKIYKFKIAAVYQTFPKGHAEVVINVLDTNDNFPKTIHPCVGNITENISPGFTIIPEISITDADSNLNAGPFRFSLLDNTEEFLIDKSTGALQNKIVFDRETMKTEYNISVRVRDNGSPPLSTKFHCTVHIIDANDNKGSPRLVQIIIADDSYRELGIGDVSPIDIDSSSRYNCSMKIRESHFFKFDPNSCFLRSSLSFEIYNKELMLSYIGQNGIAGKPIDCSFTIKRRFLKYEHFSKGVELYIHNLTSESFLSFNFNHYETYVNREFSNKLDSSPSLFIGSVKNFQGGVILVFVTMNPIERNRDLLQYHLKNNLIKLPFIKAGSKAELFDACAFKPCKNQHTSCRSTLEFDGYTILSTPKLIFHTRDAFAKTQCRCPAGFVGLRCSEVPSRCSDIPCQNKGKCINIKNGFHCGCSKYFNGKFCEHDVNECLSSPCQHGSTCVNKYGGFFCVCGQNHEGDVCETVKSSCSSNPCLNNGTCIINRESETGFKCQCRFGDWGSKCESQSWNFSPASYLEVLGNYSLFSGLEIFGDFATVEKDFLLVTFLNRYSPKEFSFFVESVKGKIRVVMATKETTIFVDSNDGKFVSDGVFHSFKVRIDDTKIYLTIDEEEVSKSHQIREIHYAHSVLIGGFKSDNEMHQIRYQMPSSAGFVGCMRRWSVNKAPIKENQLFEHSVGVHIGCKRRENACATGDICGYGNQCIDRWTEFECRCRGNGVVAKGCLRDDLSVRFSSRGISPVRVSLTDTERRKQILTQDIQKRRSTWQVNKKRHASSQETVTNNRLSISFRTRIDNGIMFNSTDSKGQTLISLDNGQLQFTFKYTGDNSQGKLVIPKKVNDGRWHVLDVVFQSPQAIDFGLDSNHTTRFSYPKTVHRFSDLSTTKEYLFGEDFLGCLGKIELDAKSFVLVSSTSEFKIEATSTIQNGCIPSNVCFAKPCQNNALDYCVDLWEAFKCVSPGQCKMPLRCQNNGRCVPIGSASFSCDCSRTQYGGDFCDIPLVCLANSCNVNEVCTTKGATYECVSMETTENTYYELLVIVLSIVFFVFVLAVGIACLSSKRRWKEKTFREEVFKEGFEGEATLQRHRNDIVLKEYNNRAYEREDEVYTTKQDMGRIRRKKETGNPSQSLPELRERPFALLKTKYRSTENFQFRNHHGCNGMITESNDVNFNNISCPATIHESSGFDSSYSEEESESVSSVSYVSTVHPEVYDIDCVSMQFSEMSFQHDQPISKEIDGKALRHHGRGYRNSGYVSESSEAYFTSSEYDYKMSLKGRRAPAFVLSENKDVHRTVDQESETSSNLAWSHSDSIHSSCEKDPKYNKGSLNNNRTKQDLRLTVLKSKKIGKINNNVEDVTRMTSFHDGGHPINEDVEAEEFV